MDDLDTAANIFINEFNIIIDNIAPSKTVNYKKDYAPYVNKNLKEKIIYNHRLISIAIQSNKTKNQRIFRHNKNTLNKDVDNAKAKYMKENLGHPKKGWNTLKTFDNTSK